mmetsp:Transcript_30508/g.98580  ORF Transcript_30508/g.98580 Transcript_30508/m.98580 type:complete len:395 (-) Transcript_30508:221-1405(-)
MPLADDPTCPAPSGRHGSLQIGSRPHRIWVHGRVQAGRATRRNLSRERRRAGGGPCLGRVPPRLLVVLHLLRLCPPDLELGALDGQLAVGCGGRLLRRLAQRELQQRTPALRLHQHPLDLAVGVKGVAQVLLRDARRQPAHPQRAHALVLGRGHLGHALRLVQVFLGQLVPIGAVVPVADGIVAGAALRVAQRLADLLHLVRRVAHAAHRPLGVQLPNQRGQQLLVGRGQLREPERAAARAVRAAAVDDAGARLTHPEGAQLGQVPVVVGRLRVVARERRQLLKVVADALAAGLVGVELLVALQRALLQSLLLVLPVELAVYVRCRHLHAARPALARRAGPHQLVAHRDGQVVLHVHQAHLADILRDGHLRCNNCLLVSRFGARLPSERCVRPP